MKKEITGFALCFLCTLLMALSFPAEAQQPKKIPRIGFVSGTGDPNAPGFQVEAFRRGLRDLGYIEGKICWLSIATLKATRTAFQAL